MDSSDIRLELCESTEHIDSCNACFARNYEPTSLFPVGKKVDKLYKLRVGMMTMSLCPECLARLRGMIDREVAQE